MSTYKLIKKRVQFSEVEKLSKELGYSSTKKATKIIESFLDSKDIYSWLHLGYYDFKYTSEEFLKKLCCIFDVDYRHVENELKKEDIYYKEVARVQKNYIFVNTNFKRKNEPIFALACLEHTRKIYLEAKEIVFKTKDEVLKIVSQTVQKHYKQSGAKLPLWGKISSYVYHQDDEIFTFSTDGKIIKNVAVDESKATLSIKGKDICQHKIH